MSYRLRDGCVWVALCCGFVGCGKQAEPLSVPPPAVESVKASPPVVQEVLTVSPAEVAFVPGDFGTQLIGVSHKPEEKTGPDVTSKIAWSVEPKGIVTVDGGYIRPVSTGKASIKATLGGSTTEVAVTVPETRERPWNVADDIVPLLTRAGCNTGGCHGRADGQNGFHLSLFGYDPASDYGAITRADGGRRLDRFNPDASLLIQKATGRVPHAGGQRILVGSPEYENLITWIRAGAPELRGKALGSMVGLRVEPADATLREPGPVQLRVLAKFENGSERDVTRQAIYKVNDDSAVSISGQGKAVLLRRAETDVVVRYGSHVIARRIGTPINPDLKYDFASRKRANFIDDELFKRLASLKIPPSPPVSDAGFIRRVTLDLTGQQPSPENVRAFLGDKDPEKRAKLIDQLLKERDFVRFWQIKFGDMLEITSARPEFTGSAPLYQSWVAARLTENTPWDKVVYTLLTSLGDPSRKEDAAANYALDGIDPKIQAEKTAQRFLGLRMRCAQCHDHPFDVWTQDDYFGLAAAFAKVGRGEPGPGNAMMMRARVSVNPKGSLEHMRTHKPAEPKLLTHQPIKVADNEDPRKPLADWITSSKNPYFARAMSNWVWAQFFGKGIVEPADDLSASNPPVHPELLDALAKSFVDNKFDLRKLIKTIVLSEAYGLSSSTVPENASDQRFFSHQIPRPLTAHQMADALAQVTDVVNRFRDRPPGTRAIEITDPATPNTILEAFGRCSRQNGCATVQTPSLSLRQALLVIGGNVVEDKVANLNGYLANLIDQKPAPSPEEIVENLYFRTLCRPPTSEELSRWTSELKDAPQLREVAEDLFWALLNSREFAFNH